MYETNIQGLNSKEMCYVLAFRPHSSTQWYPTEKNDCRRIMRDLGDPTQQVALDKHFPT